MNIESNQNGKTMTVAVAVVMLTMAACGGTRETADGKEAAAPISALTPQPSRDKPACENCDVALTPQNTQIAFTGAKIVGKHDGVFEAFSGTVAYRNDDPETARINVIIDLNSVKTDAEKLDEHLKTEDFFYVEKYPQATFVSKTVSHQSGSMYKVVGDFALRGVTREVAFDAEMKRESDILKANATFDINRQDYEVKFSGMPDNLIKDLVEIRITINARLE